MIYSHPQSCYYPTGSASTRRRILVHVWADGSITTMPYDEELSVYEAIEIMERREGFYKHFGAENAANRKKS